MYILWSAYNSLCYHDTALWLNSDSYIIWLCSSSVDQSTENSARIYKFHTFPSHRWMFVKLPRCIRGKHTISLRLTTGREESGEKIELAWRCIVYSINRFWSWRKSVSIINKGKETRIAIHQWSQTKPKGFVFLFVFCFEYFTFLSYKTVRINNMEKWIIVAAKWSIVAWTY